MGELRREIFQRVRVWPLLLVAAAACQGEVEESDAVLTTGEATYRAHEVIVRLDPKRTAEDLAAAVDDLGGRLVDTDSPVSQELGYLRVLLPEGVVADEAISTLVSSGVAAEAERNYLVEHTGVPDDPRLGELWGLSQIGATEAWDLTNGSDTIVVAVTDTGVDDAHPDLAANMWVNDGEIAGNGIDDDENGYVDDVLGWDFANDDADPHDDHGHGTHCAGTIGATGNDGVGVVGVNWNVRIMPLKMLRGSGSGSLWDGAQSILYAARMNAQVVNASWGCPGCDVSYVEDAIANLRDAGGLFVAAAGNSRNNNDTAPFFPASHEVANVISVAATTPSDNLALFSNYGAQRVHIGAPGTGILSTLPGNRYASWQGTSMAAPHVAGAAALLLSTSPDMPWDVLRTRILQTADPIAELSGKVQTGGRLNTYAMIVADSVPPAAPENVTATAGVSGDVLVNWDAVPEEDIALYRVLAGVESGNYVDTFEVTADRSELAVYPSENDRTWYFAVIAVDRAGNVGARSEEVSAVPTDDVAPPQVLDLTARALAGPRVSGSVTAASGEYSDFYGAEHAYDGSPDTAWVSPARASETEEWIIVTFDEPATIEAVDLTPGATYPEFFPIDFDIETSANGVDWSPVASKRNQYVDTPDPITTRFPPVSARALRVHATRSHRHASGNHYVSIAEIDVFSTSEVNGRVEVQFRAPGDDPGQGRAAGYDLRYATEPLDESNFDGATAVPMDPPAEAGLLERVELSGFEAESTYYFALKAVDEADNWSPLSNVASVSTLVVPPAAVVDLHLVETTADTLHLAFTAPGADGDVGRATSYDVRRSPSPITAANFLDATEVSHGLSPSEAGSSEDLFVTGLEPGTLYYVALRAVDGSGAEGGVSNVVSAIPRSAADTIPPATVTSLTARLAFTDEPVSLQAVDVSSESSSYYDKSRLVDGSPSTAWMSAYGRLEDPEWVVLDAGDTVAFSRFRIYPDALGLYTAAFPEDFAIEASADGIHWTPVVQVTGFTAEHGSWNEWRTTPVHARFLRLHATHRGPMYCSPTSCTGGFVHVAEFEAYALTRDRAVNLTWVAPGDDEWLGTAASYDLRASLAPITDTNFDAADPIATPVPKPAGGLEFVEVGPFPAETTHHFRLRSVDAAGNASALSNDALYQTPAVPPAAVTDLLVVNVTETTATLGFTASGDDGRVGTATAYDFRYLDAPLGPDNWDFGYPVVLDAPKPAGETESVTVTGLAPNTPYWFAVRVIDDAPSTSLLSNVAMTETLDGIPPNAVADLQAAPVDPAATEPLEVAVEDDSGSYSPETDPEKAFDGTADTVWMTPARAVSTVEYLEVAFDRARSLGRVRLTPATGFADLFPASFYLEVWNGTEWTRVVQETGFVATGEPEEWALGAVTAEAARLVVTETRPWGGSHYAALGEIEFHEDPTDRSRVRLSWTAPGDDGETGTAARYDLRRASVPLNAVNFASGTAVDAPSPAAAGHLERVEVDGLAPEATVCFSLRALDERDNASDVSNSACTTTPGLPPSTVTDLAVVSATPDSITLEWTAPGGRGTSGTAASYDLRYATERINEGSWDTATPAFDPPVPAPVGTRQQMTVTGLSGLSHYTFALRSINDVGTVSPLSNNAAGSTADDVPPSAIADLVASTDASTTGALLLTWTAPGDSGLAGTAAEYDVRHSLAPIDEATFDAATRVSVDAPATPGTEESVQLTGLAPETLFYVAVRTRDEAGNWSALSNSASARTRDEAPAAVSDLVLTAVGGAPSPTITVSWTAPGDDGLDGEATRYDLRLSESPITTANFESALSVAAPDPATATTPETVTIDGLEPGQAYYAALITEDERGNRSALSNLATTETVDEVPPSQVTDLVAATGTRAGRLSLQWTAPGDDESEGRATRYDVRWALSPITSEAAFAAATEASPVPAPATAGTPQSFELSGLPDENDVFVALRAVDDAGNTAAVSNSAGARTLDVPPARTLDLRQTGAESESITVSFTAAGDDGTVGTATEYDVRYAAAPITEANFGGATPVPTGAPNPAGTTESVSIEGLESNQTYYVALQTVDERGNRSPLSNVVAAETADLLAPGAITDLAAATGTVSGSLVLSWTAVGDDGTTGTASAYELRRSDAPITSGNWDAAEALSISRPPGAAGTPESFTVTDLSGEETHHVALRVRDEAGNLGPVSNSASADTPPIPPAQIDDLAAAARDGAVDLTFRAVGDDGMSGTASSYDVRFSDRPLNAGNFDDAAQAFVSDTPKPPGEVESVEVTGLAESTSYWFAVAAIDDVGARGPISNVETATTPDLTPPGVPSSFTATSPTAEEAAGARLPALGVAASSTLGSSWNAIYATDRIASTAWASAASAVPSPVDVAVALTSGSSPIPRVQRVRLLPDASYPQLFPRGFSIEVTADGTNWSPVATEEVFTTETAEWIEWGFPARSAQSVRIVTSDLASSYDQHYSVVAEIEAYGEGLTSGQVQLSWIAPGDDGSSGTAARYEVFRHDAPFTVDTLEDATRLDGLLTPRAGGSLETVVVNGLQGEANTYWAVRAVDEAGLTGPLSSVAHVETNPVPPAPVDDLTAVALDRTSTEVTFTAPGDDGNQGAADRYELRYAPWSISSVNFADATEVLTVPTPSVAGTRETALVDGLLPGTRYRFALVAYDEADHGSYLSNVASVETVPDPDTTPPEAVTDLTAVLPSPGGTPIPLVLADVTNEEAPDFLGTAAIDGSASTAWSTGPRPADEPEWLVVDTGEVREASRVRIRASAAFPHLFPRALEVRVSPDGLGYESVFAESTVSADPVIPVEVLVTGRSHRFIEVRATELAPFDASTYYAVIAEVEALTVDLPPGTVFVTWTATGDDNREGTASSYDLRRSTCPYVHAAATPVTTWAPEVAGAPERIQVDGLTSGDHCFGLVVSDEVPNASALSNVASVTVP